MKLKRIIGVLLLAVTIVSLTACGSDTAKEFLEPEGCVIAKVYYGDRTWRYERYAFGYISEDVYQKFLDGTADSVIVIWHPYEEGKNVSVPTQNIEAIVVGDYNRSL